MDQGLWECGRGEKDMHAIPSSSMYFRHINSGLFRRAEQELRIYPIDHMVDIPSNSQRPETFHPDFDREVYAVVFSVGSLFYY
jgi:hypothetical protein